jgi:hypothetical protein
MPSSPIHIFSRAGWKRLDAARLCLVTSVHDLHYQGLQTPPTTLLVPRAGCCSFTRTYSPMLIFSYYLFDHCAGVHHRLCSNTDFLRTLWRPDLIRYRLFCPCIKIGANFFIKKTLTFFRLFFSGPPRVSVIQRAL